MVRPSKPVVAPQGDSQMWLAYTNSLKQKFFPELDPKTQAFYAVPISELGIAAGNNIPKEATNKGVFDCADPMPLLSTPVYGVSTRSFSDRMTSYLGTVALRRTDRGAQIRLNQAIAKSSNLMDEFKEQQAKASAHYNADQNKGAMTFNQWVSVNYPSYQSLVRETQAANAMEASLRLQVEGPDAQELIRLKSAVHNSGDLGTSYDGLNMPVVATDQSTAGTLYLPSYSIDASYGDAAQSWLAQAGTNTPVLSFNLQDAQKGQWADSGFNNLSSDGKLGSPPFFRIRYSAEGRTREETISTEEAGSSLNIQLTATGTGVFAVKPGAWDVPEMENKYPNLASTSAFSFPGGCKVTDLLMGHKVAMVVQMSSDMKNRVQEMTSKAVQAGGDVSFFGHKLSLGSATTLEQMFNQPDGTTVKFPLDPGYPVLLGVKGTKLQEVKVAKA